MAFFYFSLNVPFSYHSVLIDQHKTYYSKDITLWKELNNKKKKKQLSFIKYANREKVTHIGKNLLICLPPKFGLGDAIEYCIAIKSLVESKKFTKIGGSIL